MKKREKKSILGQISALLGNNKSKNVQVGTNKTIESMDLLKWKTERIKNVGFQQAKGNLFEYIETAKLQRNLANQTGITYDKSPLTDVGKHMGGLGENTAPDDFRFIHNNKIVGRGQAKFNNDTHKAAHNFVNPKYKDMQRVAPVDQIPEIESHLKRMYQNGEISKDMYQNAMDNLQFTGLQDPITGISSGGTTTEEIMFLQGKDGRVSEEKVRTYVRKLEQNQFCKEIGETAKNSALAGTLTTGIVSGVENVYAVLEKEKDLDEALKDIGIDAVKGGVRGGVAGTLSASMRIMGVKNKIPVISDSISSTIIANSIIDSGVAIYAYTKGELNKEELGQALQDTTIKTTATIYYTKALGMALKSVNPFITMTIYSVASYTVTCTREIIENAKLKADEYRRIAVLLEESTKLMYEYRKEMNRYLSEYEEEQRKIFEGFLLGVDYDPKTGNGYEKTLDTIVTFAKKTDIYLQHTNFDDYCEAMISDKEFVLK